jgi:hypothetical protein
MDSGRRHTVDEDARLSSAVHERETSKGWSVVAAFSNVDRVTVKCAAGEMHSLPVQSRKRTRTGS